MSSPVPHSPEAWEADKRARVTIAVLVALRVHILDYQLRGSTRTVDDLSARIGAGIPLARQLVESAQTLEELDEATALTRQTNEYLDQRDSENEVLDRITTDIELGENAYLTILLGINLRLRLGFYLQSALFQGSWEQGGTDGD